MEEQGSEGSRPDFEIRSHSMIAVYKKMVIPSPSRWYSRAVLLSKPCLAFFLIGCLELSAFGLLITRINCKPRFVSHTAKSHSYHFDMDPHLTNPASGSLHHAGGAAG